jgi:homoserine O-succinyltransferase
MPLFLDSGWLGSDVALNAGNCITVGLVNNMPDAAVEATERQFTELLRAAAPKAVVVLKLFSIPTVPRGEAMRREFAERYRDIAELWDTPLDGLIVTGTEPRAKNLADEPYCETLTKVVDWARDNTASAIWSCLAAHAAVLHDDGIERRALKEKLFGIFDCQLVAGFSGAGLRSAFPLQRPAGAAAEILWLQDSDPFGLRRRRYVRQAR